MWLSSGQGKERGNLRSTVHRLAARRLVAMRSRKEGKEGNKRRPRARTLGVSGSTKEGKQDYIQNSEGTTTLLSILYVVFLLWSPTNYI